MQQKRKKTMTDKQSGSQWKADVGKCDKQQYLEGENKKSGIW